MRIGLISMSIIVAALPKIGHAECDYDSAERAARAFAQTITYHGQYKVYLSQLRLMTANNADEPGALFLAPIAIISTESPNLIRVGNLVIYQSEHGKCVVIDHAISSTEFR